MGSACKDLSLLLETASEIGSLLSSFDLNSFFLMLDIKLPSLPSFVLCDDSTKQAVRFATEQVRLDTCLKPSFGVDFEDGMEDTLGNDN